MGQRRISDFTEASSVDGDAVVPIVQSGANYKATRYVFQEALKDSLDTQIATSASGISNLSDDLDNLESSVSDLIGWTIEITDGGDSIKFAYGSSYYVKVATDRAVVPDLVVPTVSSAEVGTLASDTIVLTMSETMGAYTSANSSWTFYEDNVLFGVDTTLVSGTTLKIALDSAVASETALLLNYTRPGTSNDFQDASANYLASFTDYQVTNNVTCQSVSVLAHYRFENNANDETTNYNATANGGVVYTGAAKVEGSYAGDFDDNGDEYFAIPSMPYTGELTVAFWITSGSNVGQRTLYSTLQSNDGFQIDYDFANDIIYLYTGSGGSLTTAYSTTTAGVGYPAYEHIAVVISQSAGTAAFYFDGVNVTSVSSINTGFTTTSIGRFGIDMSGNDQMFSWADDLQIYATTLSASDIGELVSTPGTSLSVGNCGDISPITTTVVWDEDFEDFTVAEDIYRYQFQNFMDGVFVDMGSELDTIADDVAIASFDGGKSYRSDYLQGQCCTEVQTGVPSDGGTGSDPRFYITSSTTFYEELYFAYNVYYDADFTQNEAHKMPALGFSSSNRTARLMIKYIDGSNEGLNPTFYYSYYPSYGSAYQMYSSNTPISGLSRGEWHNICYRLYSGTPQGGNGLFELFIDGVFTGHGRYNIKWEDSGDPTGWSYIDFSTFMGGSSESYDSPQDQSMYIDDAVIWYINSGQDVPYTTTPSGAGRVLDLPTEANFNPGTGTRN